MKCIPPGAGCRCDCDSYRPDTLVSGIEYGFRRPRDKAENELRVPPNNRHRFHQLPEGFGLGLNEKARVDCDTYLRDLRGVILSRRLHG